MQTHLVFTVIARDRPGLVEQMADTIAAHGGNWIDSSMARLGGEFAGIVRIAVDAEKSVELTGALSALSSSGLDITLRSGKPEDGPSAGAAAQLELVSQDHPGILRDVTHVLSTLGVSIEHLETEVAAGSMQGEALFKARAALRLPDGLAATDLSAALEETAGDLMADVTVDG